MKVELHIEDGLKHRDDLIRIMKAAAEFLESRDTDSDSQAFAVWRLWSGSNSETWIELQLQDEGYSKTMNFSPNQLVPADIRELRLVQVWNDVLQQRTQRQFLRVNELISQMED